LYVPNAMTYISVHFENTVKVYFLTCSKLLSIYQQIEYSLRICQPYARHLLDTQEWRLRYISHVSSMYLIQWHKGGQLCTHATHTLLVYAPNMLCIQATLSTQAHIRYAYYLLMCLHTLHWGWLTLTYAHTPRQTFLIFYLNTSYMLYKCW